MNGARPSQATPLVFLAIGVGAMAATIAGMVTEPERVFQSYLFAYLFWLGLSLGSLAIRMIHCLSGGSWGEFIHEPLLAASRLLPLLALLAIPLGFALPRLFLWAQHSSAHAELIAQKHWYLNYGFFYTRAGIYLALWSIGPFLLDWPRGARWRRRLSAAGLILFAVTTYTAGVDWILALNLQFSSAIFGLIVATGEMLSALALAIVASYLMTRGAPPAAGLSSRFHDLGGLLLMLLLAWSYLAACQFVTVWVADLPREIVWYLPRLDTNWRDFGLVMVAIHFVVPFLLLLSQRLKSSPPGLTMVAALLLAAQLAYEFWQVAPNLRGAGFDFYWSDLPAVAAVGGLWLWLYTRQLRRPAAGTRLEPDYA